MSSRAFDFAAALIRHSFSSPWLSLAAGLSFAWILSSLLAHFFSYKFKSYPPAIPGAPILGNLYQLKERKPFKTFCEWTDKYGPIYTVKFGSTTMVVINSSEIAKEAMIDKFSSISTRKTSTALSIVSSQKTMVVASDYDDEHRILKKQMVTNLLGPNPQKANRHLRERAYMTVIDNIYSEIGASASVVDVKENMKTALFPFALTQVIGRAPESVYVDELGKNVLRWEMYKALILDPLEAVLHVDWRDFFPYLKWVPRKSLEETIQSVRQKRDAIVGALIDEERKLLANGKKPNCCLDILLTEATHLTDKQLLMSVWEPIIEAVDTSMTTIEWAMYEIAMHPHIQEKLCEEIDNIVGKRCVNEDDLPKLKYLEAIVKETLRKHAAVPLPLPRHVDEDTTLGGYDIRKGWQIIINVYAINHDKDVWANPEEWNPERVLGDERVDMGFKDYRILSFGAGKRMCPGVSQAMNIISTCIAIMVQHFKWELPPGSMKQAVNTTLITNQMQHPLKAIAIPRISSRLSA